MKNVVRVGKISSINVERMRARVVFEDRDSSAGELVSAELPLLSFGAGNNKYYFNYRVNESVVCIFTGNSKDGDGYIVGSYNTDKSELRAGNEHVTRFDFGDKYNIEYNEETGNLNINVQDKYKISFQGETGDVDIKITGNLTITAEQEIILKGKNIRLN